MPFARVRDTALHYQLLRCDTSRHAETVVMIHGLAASMAFWYFQLAPQIAKNYNVLVYDLKGHGGSRMVPGGYSAEAMADDLVLLLDALDVTRAHIIAHSFGGSIALHFVLRFPQRVASLTRAWRRSPRFPSPRGSSPSSPRRSMPSMCARVDSAAGPSSSSTRPRAA